MVVLRKCSVLSRGDSFSSAITKQFASSHTPSPASEVFSALTLFLLIFQKNNLKTAFAR